MEKNKLQIRVATKEEDVYKRQVYNGSGWDELTKGAGYTHPNTPGNKHIPAGGVSGQVLGWSADGQAKWVEDKDTTYNPATTGTNLSLIHI